ncbi:MAG: hypothetical protein ACRDDX_03205 [Cellulosilyticaceae bacterium]
MYCERCCWEMNHGKLLGEGEQAAVGTSVFNIGGIVKNTQFKQIKQDIKKKIVMLTQDCSGNILTQVLLVGQFDVELELTTVVNQTEEVITVPYVLPFNQVIELCEVYDEMVESKLEIEHQKATIEELGNGFIGLQVELVWNTCIFPK